MVQSNIKEVWQRGLLQWIANPPMFFKGIRWFESNHFRLGELSERLMVQTWKVCVGKTTRGSNPLFSVGLQQGAC